MEPDQVGRDPLTGSLETVSQIASTNTELLARVGRGDLPFEGNWLVADRQSAGRGRAGRVWNDGFGNFMGSTVAWLRAGDPPAPTLSLVAGVAVIRALHDVCGLLSGAILKWPNDVLVRGAKLAGILLERQGDCIVVGIGVNLVLAPEVEGRETVSLASLGHAVSRDSFAFALSAQWRSALECWHRGEWPSLREDWLAYAHRKGTLLSVRDPSGGAIMGGFAGLTPDGAALLHLADGQRRAIHAGDIELVGE